MQTYCASCRKHTDKIGSKKKTMTNEVKVIRDKSRPAISWSNKSRFLEQNPNKKTDQNNVNPIFFIN